MASIHTIHDHDHEAAGPALDTTPVGLVSEMVITLPGDILAFFFGLSSVILFSLIMNDSSI